MATFTPHYRMRLYAEDDSTVLTPRSGAAHSSAFQIATKTITGYKPYMEPPTGRTGRIDPLTRQTDKGTVVVSTLDFRTSTSNAQRWITAFIGDDNGDTQFLNRKAVIERATDGSTWEAYWTGRVNAVRLRGKLRLEFEIRDMSEELEWDVYTGIPHADIDYAIRPHVVPQQLTEAYGGLSAGSRIAGVIGTSSGYRVVRVSSSPSGNRLRALVPENIRELIPARDTVFEGGRVRLTRTDTSASGEFYISRTSNTSGTGGGEGSLRLFTLAPIINDDHTAPLDSIGISELDASDPAYMAIPADDVEVEFEVLLDAPGEDTPLYIEPDHPATLIADLCAGKFGRLNTNGSVKWTVARGEVEGYTSGDVWAPILDDTSFPLVRYAITESMTLNEAIEQICRDAGLGYYLNASGELVLVDMRRPTATPTAVTIDDTDLVEGAEVGWEQRADDSVGRVDVTYYVDELGDPTTKKIVSYDELYVDAGDEKNGFEIDAKGLRVVASAAGFLDLSVTDARNRAAALVDEARGPYGKGPQIARLPCRLTSNTSTVMPGTWRLVAVSTLPDPATNQRGGTRLMRCIGVEEEGARRTLVMLDAGEDSVAVAPTLGDPAQTTGDEEHSITFDITLNAAGEKARVYIAETLTSVSSAPAWGSADWKLAGIQYESGTVVLDYLRPNRRYWPAAVSAPDNKLWSGPEYPTTEYVDTASAPEIETLTVTPRFIEGEGHSVLVEWSVINTLGIRINYESHEAADTPSLATSVDVDAADGQYVFTGYMGPVFTVDVEPWSGWTDPDVSGTEGTHVTRSVAIPQQPHATLIFAGLVLTGETTVDLSIRCVASADKLPATVRVYSPRPKNILGETGTLQFSHTFTANNEEIDGTDYATLTDVAIKDVPTFWAELTAQDGTISWHQALLAMPSITGVPLVDQVQWGGGPTSFSLAFRVRAGVDSTTGGTVSVWLPGTDTSGAADGTLAVASTPSTIDSLDTFTGSVDLGDITGGPDEMRIVTVDFTTTDGRTTGQVQLPIPDVRSMLMDSLGRLQGDTVYNAFVLAEGLRPYNVPANLAALNADAAAYAAISDRAVALDTGIAYLWDGDSWEEDTTTPAVAYAPVLRAGVVTAVHVTLSTLSELTQDAGIIVSGALHNLLDTAGINLDAVGTEAFIYHDGFTLLADGSAFFGGELQAATGSFTGGVSIDVGQSLDFLYDIAGTPTAVAGVTTAGIGKIAMETSLSSFSLSTQLVGDILYTTADVTAQIISFGSNLAPSIDINGAADSISISANTISLDGDVDLGGGVISYDANDSAGAGFRYVIAPNAP